MRIAVDVQPLICGKRTGIGFYQTDLLKAAIKMFPEYKFILNFFSLRNTEEKIKKLRELFGEDVEIRPCKWFSYSILHRLWLFLPVPYRWFFHQKADASLFFNYYVPPYAEGRVFSVVYDMVVMDLPESMDGRTRTALNLTLKKSIRRSDTVITISEYSKQRIMHHFHVPEKNLGVIPCGIDRAVFHTGCSEEEIEACKKRLGINEKYILYLGTLEPRKNITGLIEAYRLLSDGLPDCPELVIAGGRGWLYEEIFSLVERYDLTDRVHFTGYVSESDVPLLMSGAELFCFPSFYEGFGMPPLEAMACGTPTIVSDRASLPEVVGDAALTVDPELPAEICNAMKKILTDPPLKNLLSQKGVARAAVFTWENSAAELNKLIGE